MAITTLPYPNMDFVPLDVLTADELDQIVANIDAINNASIPTDSIADGAVTSGKIDYATLANYVSHLTNNVTLSASYKVLNTLTIAEAGSYFVAGYAGFYRTASTESSDFQMQITGGDWTPYAIVTLPTAGGYPSATAVGIITVSANATITLQARFTNSGGAFAGRAEYMHSLVAFRVG